MLRMNLLSMANEGQYCQIIVQVNKPFNVNLFMTAIKEIFKTTEFVTVVGRPVVFIHSIKINLTQFNHGHEVKNIDISFLCKLNQSINGLQ